MATENELTFDKIMALMEEKDFDEGEVIIEGSHIVKEDKLNEEELRLEKEFRLALAYLKEIDQISSSLAGRLIAK